MSPAWRRRPRCPLPSDPTLLSPSALADLAAAGGLLRDLCLALHVGPLVAFAALLAAAGHAPGLAPATAVRAFRAWGPGAGLTLGFAIFGALLERWARTGAFRWTFDTPSAQLESAAWIVFFAFWVHNVRVEVWTLEPLRRLDPPDRGITDAPAWEQAWRRLTRAVLVQAAAGLAVLVLGSLSRS
jgi:hypothetical protein